MTKLSQLFVVGLIFSSTIALGSTNDYETKIAISRYSSWGVDPDKKLASINTSKVYKKFDSKKTVVVAVIDTGIQFDHPFLKDNIYIPSGKVSKLNYGIDFSIDSSTKTPIDDHGHGTHVSGIIKSVYPDVKILSLKYYNPKASGKANLDATLKALNYAIDQKVDIINYSGGGPEASVDELRLLKKAENQGILVVAASGNERSNIDDRTHAYYPASYNLSNIITVGAHDDSLQIIPSSNYGRNSVDIAAPGHRIRSAIPGSSAGYMTGTSQATAFVSGVAALIKANEPGLTAKQIKLIIKTSGTSIKNFEGKIIGAKKLNAFNAYKVAQKFMSIQKSQNNRQISSIDEEPLSKTWGLEKIKVPTNKVVSDSIVIGVVDTGIDFNHPELSDSMWVNPKEKKDGKDNDGNGYIDDISGYDFATKSGKIIDTHGHGTHIAGIISGKEMSVAPKIKLSSYRYFLNTHDDLIKTPEYKKLKASKKTISKEELANLNNGLSLDNSNKALKLAIEHGVKIINYSGGGYEPESEEKRLLELANEKNILVVVAAGNGDPVSNLGIDMDEKNSLKYYPCAYNLPNIICVGNVDTHLENVESGNMGITLTHIAAPGKKIYSTQAFFGHKFLTGTSQSTAFVTGVAGLVLSANPKLFPAQVKSLLINSATKVMGLKFKNLAGGIVNAEEALIHAQDEKYLTLDINSITQKLMAEKNALKREISVEKLKENVKN